MDFYVGKSDYYIARATLNDVIDKLVTGSGEMEETEFKPSKVNGWQLYHKKCCEDMLKEVENNENVPPPSLAEMCKISARSWKTLRVEERKMWNDKGQSIRENEDIGTSTTTKSCKKCEKTFNRQRDLRHHEKNCERVVCAQCGKSFDTKIALSRHMKRYTENYLCDQCEILCCDSRLDCLKF